MKMSDWEILHCVRRSRKGPAGEKGRDAKTSSVDLVPLAPVKSTVQKWQKVIEKKEEKAH